MIATIWEPFLTVGVKYANNDATRRAEDFSHVGGFCRKGGICRICMLAQRPAIHSVRRRNSGVVNVIA